MIIEIDKICPEEGLLNAQNQQQTVNDQRLTPE
jgi:hypothetical protein